MTHPYLASSVVKQRERDIRASAARARLVAIARCCHPSRIREAINVLRARIQRPTAAPLCCS